MLRARLEELCAALGLLTRLPLGRLPFPTEPQGYARAVWAYPLVGGALGAFCGTVQWALVAAGLPPALAAPWAIAVLLLASGALHEDGLADTADGFGGGRDAARKLAIMRDSRIGSFGALALMLALATRGLGLAGAEQPVALMAGAGALGRAAMLLPLGLLPPARTDGLAAGLGKPPRAALLAGIALGLVIGAALLPPAAILAALAVGGGMSWLARKQIGGHTGDVLGATALVAECAAISLGQGAPPPGPPPGG
ncbi:adenosylcobinamide-GDP ribazoletransferase [Pseudoroseomonas cervicalis]|uniref:Adenosylcobinamide-GDP ribazoletransferase n=1 Tax=Pseudoroseomonas cervicalis ATCC 49957 TaxID=525371 RepID=D5RL22_9PROT|nr:adenosylcobinamide-GDP ribazoletransferase [Pseudoroseomonas cervicalis]EFH12008.1 cobalamin-5-phosphate synthase [Pseudoroseomonas cervicalis ATCC 49957]